MPKDYTPPPSGGHSEKEKRVLDEVYSKCRSEQKVADKEKCAKIAWGAANKVKKIEFTKENKDKLSQILKELKEVTNDLTKGKARKLQMLGYAKRHQEQKKQS